MENICNILKSTKNIVRFSLQIFKIFLRGNAKSDDMAIAYVSSCFYYNNNQYRGLRINSL